MPRLFVLILACTALCLLPACATLEKNNVARTSAVGGVAGAGLGAGAGALIGSLISSGDVGASALLGAGIGLPAGLIIGALYAAQQNKNVLEENQERIDENYEVIIQREREIQELREEMDIDSRTLEPNESRKEYQYIGPSLGNYYR